MTLTSYKSSKSYQNLGQNLGLCGAIFALIALFFLTACGASDALNNLGKQLSEYERAQAELQKSTNAEVKADTSFTEALEAERIAVAAGDVEAQKTAQANLLKAAEALRQARLERDKARINEEKATAEALGQAKIDEAAKELADAEKAVAAALKKAQEDKEKAEQLDDSDEKETALAQAEEATEEATQQAVVINRIQQFQTSSATANQPTIEQATPTPTVEVEVERAKSSSDSDFIEAQAKIAKFHREEAARILAREVRYELWQRKTAAKYNLPALDTAPDWDKRFQNQFLRNPFGRDDVYYYDYRRRGPHIGLSGYDHVSKRTDDKALLGTGTNDVLGEGTSITGGYSYFNGLWSIDDAYWWAFPWTGAQRSYYATIHQDTNVGDILPTHLPKALWKVNFSAITSETWAYTGDFLNNRDTIVETTIPMEIDFVNQTFAATIKYKYYKIHNYKFRIDGYYDKYGFVQGDIFNTWDDANDSPGDFGKGKITGLIGDKGLVAVFIADQRTGYREKHFGYSGGFIACPTVNKQGTGACRAKQ